MAATKKSKKTAKLEPMFDAAGECINPNQLEVAGVIKPGEVVLKPRVEAVAEKLLESVDPISTDGFAAARRRKEQYLANATPAQRLEYLDDPFFRMPVKEQVQTEKYYAARNNLDPSYVTATNVVEVHRERVAAEKTGRKTAVKVEVATEVEGAKVEKKVSGKKGFEIFGHSHTKITVWAGNQPDWTVSDVQTMLKKLTGQDVSILSIRTFFYAGRAGVKPTGNTTDEKTANGGRGPTVKLTADQIAVLCEAAGKTPKVVEEPKKTTKKKKSK